MQDFVTRIIGRKWLHSHEEDGAVESVFRPSTYNFPRSRGRTGFELMQDGTAVVHGPGPNDAPQQVPAKWTLGGENELCLHLPSQETRKYQVLSAEPDRLVVKKA
jgi:hypothetical protein